MKKTASLLFSLLLALSMTVGASAYTTDVGADGGVTYTPEYIFDGAGLLDIDDFIALEDAAARLSAQYGCGVYLFTTDDMTSYGYYDISDLAEAVYDELSLGVGEDRSCILLTLSMAERDYVLMAHGTVGNGAFTDYGKYLLEDEFLDNFREDDWYGGFADYVSECERYLAAYAAGTPIDVEPEEPLTLGEKLFAGLMFGFLPALLIAFLVCALLKRQLKSAKRATDADRYTVSGGTEITAREDRFTHVTEVRTPKAEPKKKSGGSGFKGGTTVNSRGFSHSKGKF